MKAALRHGARHQQAGLSLVELMIGIGLGLFVVGGLLTFFTNSLASNRFAYQNSRLNQEMNAVMEMMVRDIRRAGYWGPAQNGIGNATAYVANPFISDIASGDGGISTSTNPPCILYRYDRSEDGALQDSEKMGFRLSNGVLQVRTGGSGHACTDINNTWEALTDAQSITITALSFTKTHESTTLSTGTACSRNVDIVMTGQLKTDALTTRTLRQSVRVRADWYRSTGACP